MGWDGLASRLRSGRVHLGDAVRPQAVQRLSGEVGDPPPPAALVTRGLVEDAAAVLYWQTAACQRYHPAHIDRYLAAWRRWRPLIA